MDPLLLEAWISARSIVRGLPRPISEYGGFRVDTNSETEIARWVFPKVGSGLKELARSINETRYFLKLCGAADELRAALPAGWWIHAPGYFMQASGECVRRDLIEGYQIEVGRIGMVVEARIFSVTGALAASGYAAETPEVFIYDRIITEREHRRKGLGSFIMTALHAAKKISSIPEVLVATEDGRALYSALGWETISPYSTASIIMP